MMKHFKFTAEECIGWLRIVRPGSIIGPQQQVQIDDRTAVFFRFGILFTERFDSISSLIYFINQSL